VKRTGYETPHYAAFSILTPNVDELCPPYLNISLICWRYSLHRRQNVNTCM